jgi:hypothetical protein
LPYLYITPLARGEAEKVAVQLTKSLSNVKFRSNIYLKNFFRSEGLLADKFEEEEISLEPWTPVQLARLMNLF